MKNLKKKEKICFVISPIGESESEIRKRSDQVLKYIICPVVEKFGYKALRADQIAEPGIITSQVIQNILDSPLVIADLTDNNPNVFYELALRHAIKKPLIQIIRKNDSIPFDVAATRIIRFDIQDLDNVEIAKKEIENQLSVIKSGKIEFDNPLSTSIELKSLKQSGNPEQRSLAEVIEIVGELRSSIMNIEKRSYNNSPEFNDFTSGITRTKSKEHPFPIYYRLNHDIEIIIEQIEKNYNKKIVDPHFLRDVIRRLHSFRIDLKAVLLHRF
jgi:hypothetical protein